LVFRLECGRTDLLFSSNIGVWNVAFRATARKVTLKKGATDPIDSLVTHYGAMTFFAPELMKEAIVTVFLTRMLLPNSGRGEFGTEALDTAAVIHRMMRAIKFNCHEVLDALNVADESPPARIGFAVNPNMAMVRSWR
jgi:hypothetical protein